MVYAYWMSFEKCNRVICSRRGAMYGIRSHLEVALMAVLAMNHTGWQDYWQKIVHCRSLSVQLELVKQIVDFGKEDLVVCGILLKLISSDFTI